MKNLITLFTTKLNIKGNLFAERLKCCVNGAYIKNYSICNCRAMATTPTIFNLTSNSVLKQHTDSNYRIYDARKRFCSSNSGPPSTKLPPLMNFPEIVWPSFIKSIRNFILSTFIIKPYLDNDFNLPDFVRGAKQALEVVSTKISQGDLKNLDGLVTSDVLHSVQKSSSLMSVFQREQIAIKSEDIYFSFPYQVGIMFNEADNDQKRFVEITMVFHTFRGFAAMRDRGEEPPSFNMVMAPEYQNRLSICNYRFIREYTKGAENNWTINLLNHFKPTDQMQE